MICPRCGAEITGYYCTNKIYHTGETELSLCGFAISKEEREKKQKESKGKRTTCIDCGSSELHSKCRCKKCTSVYNKACIAKQKLKPNYQGIRKAILKRYYEKNKAKIKLNRLENKDYHKKWYMNNKEAK